MHGSVSAWLAAIATGILTMLPGAVPGQAVPAHSLTLETVVTDKLLDRATLLPAHAGGPAGQVTITRRSGAWAFGMAVLPAATQTDAEPQDWVFLALRQHGAWQVGFAGEPAFAALSAQAPLISAQERMIFASHGGHASTAANGDYRTGMQLPWTIGQAWTLLGGPHAWDAGTGPRSSLDLTGGDHRVLAARAGVAYTTCTGRILVYHDRGYTTRYYHLWDYVQFDGQSVNAGAFLGYTGTEVGCGGSARSRHVHFSLLQNGNYVAIARHIIGKWLPMEGAAQYEGYALHGSTRVNVGGQLHNYGPLGFTQGIVDANGGGTLNKRSGPGTGYSIVGTLQDGTTATVSCSASGTSHAGRWGSTSVWDKLTDGTWVSDAYLYTGVSGPVNGWC
jgi:LasA protease